MEDKYLWLEAIHDEKSIAWVKDKNKDSIEKLKAHPLFSEIESMALKIYASIDKIPFVSIVGDYVYNLWNDELSIQGLYRRTTIIDYLKTNPEWEILLDLDELSKKENNEWILKNFVLNEDDTRALVFLSPGGSDANIMREFDIVTKEFIKDGFTLPESKGSAHWVDNNTLRIERVFDQDSVTESGYARTIREWKRGLPLNLALTVFEIDKKEIYAYSKDMRTCSKTYFILGKGIDFFNNEESVFQNGSWQKLNIPTMNQDYGVVVNQYILMIKENWQNFSSGDVVSYNLETHQSKLIFSPNDNQSVYSISRSKSGFYAVLDEDVKGVLYKFTLDKNENWSKVKINLPENGSIDFVATDYQSDKFFVNFSSFNQPSVYFYGEGDEIICTAKTTPSFFNHEQVVVTQNFVSSLDGTKIPYFLVHNKDAIFDGKNPTILYGYGGFEVSIKPSFSNTMGSSWFERGGVYVVANIRGGGEYGPAWHQAALKSARHKAYEDFFAVGEDLINRKITSRDHLGAMGGSNGGLLMGVCFTQRPDLFKAINCMVPLLDMHRYHKLLAGASWVAEYGNPDDEVDGAYIKLISPYQCIKIKEDYPFMYLNTSTKDDRVHPGHARKFAAKLMEFNHPVYYFENTLGGHAGAANFKEDAFAHAMDMCFFWKHLK